MAVFTKNLRKHIFVHPGDQHKLHNAIKIALMKDKKKYSDRLEGALLGVSKIQVMGDRYLVVNGYFSMEVVADFQVFSPTAGMTLEGVINKVNRSHYGCLVMDLFNASLSVPDYSGLAPNEGDSCSFVVTKVVVDGDLLFIRGEMTSVTPCENYTPFPSYQDTWDPTTNTEASKPILPVEIKEELDRSYDDGTSPRTEPTLGKRKRISLAESTEEDSFTINESSKKHKKKHKKEKQHDDYSPGLGEDNMINGMVVVKQEPDTNNTNRAVIGNGEEGVTLKSPKKHKKKHKRSDRESTDYPAAGRDTSGLVESHSPVCGGDGPLIKSEPGVVISPSKAAVKEEEDTSPRKHKKHKKHKKRDSSLSEVDGGGETIISETETKSFMNGSGDHNNQSSLPLDQEEEEKSPNKKHKKKKHKSKSDGDCDESFVDSPSFTPGGKDSVGSVADVVVKTEPISPRKKSKKSRVRDPC